MNYENHDEIASSPIDSITDLVPVLPPLPIPERGLRELFAEIHRSWLMKSTSVDTATKLRSRRWPVHPVRRKSARSPRKVSVRPAHDVAAWRDNLQQRGLTNSSVRRKLTALRSLFSYLQVYGHRGANPAHSDFVEAPPAPRDGKTVGLSPKDCRRLLDAPNLETPAGVRDHALLAVLAYTGCRVGELARLRIRDYKRRALIESWRFKEKVERSGVRPLPVEAGRTSRRLAGRVSCSERSAVSPTLTARGARPRWFRPQPMSRERWNT